MCTKVCYPCGAPYPPTDYNNKSPVIMYVCMYVCTINSLAAYFFYNLPPCKTFCFYFTDVLL